MKLRLIQYIVVYFLLSNFTHICFTAPPEDWPQYRGAQGNGISKEKGLLQEWPETGPPELWRVVIGQGFSGISVSGNYVLTMDSNSESEFLLCLDAASGRTLWRARVDTLYKNAHGSGPRSTPTIDGAMVYALSASGNLYAKRISDGSTVWHVDIPKNYGRVDGYFFGYSMSPFVEGELVFLAAGVDSTKSILALNKHTGALEWATHSDWLTYSSPIAFDFAGQRQIVFVTGHNIISVSPQGDILWQQPWTEGQFKLKAAMPLFIAPDIVFASMSYDEGAFALRLLQDGATIKVQEAWKERKMRNHFNSSILVGQSIYGFDNATLKCLDAQTGKTNWVKHRLGGKGSIIFADGHLIVLNEYGKLHLVKATAEAYHEIAAVKIFDGRTWTSPTLANGRLFIRNEKGMVCLDLRK